MSRVFRFAPPDPRPDLVVRLRLLRSLAGRWKHRVTSLTGGPGLGKTTVLAQAVAENRLAPRGEDRWVGLEPHDADAASLAQAVTAAIALPGDDQGREGGEVGEVARQDPPADPRTVADAVWRRAPTEECLVFDDVHLLTPGSTGAVWLGDLVAALPANGHVVLASRSDPPVRLGRYSTRGEVLLLAEADLRFDSDELSGFARLRGIDPEWLDVTGGWPAMAELVASVDRRLTGTYLWEEVLEPLGTVRRHLLAVLCDLDGADDELMSAAVDAPVDLARALDGVPLIARRADGWYVPHGLWRDAPGLVLDPTEQAGMRRRAVDNLVARHRFDEAFTLLDEAGLWDLAPTVLRAACLAPDRLASADLRRWLAKAPPSVEGTVGGALAAGVDIWLRSPADAVKPLRRAAKQARAAGDVDAEVTALAQLGLAAWWRQDLAVLAELIAPVMRLDATGNRRARGLATLGRALFADLAGDGPQVLAELADIQPDELDPAWEVAVLWLTVAVRIDQGDLDGALDVVQVVGRGAQPAQQYVLDALEIWARWWQGDVEQLLARIPGTVAAARRVGAGPYLHVGLVLACLAHAELGHMDAARGYFDDAVATAPPSDDGVLPASLLLCRAVLQVGDEDFDGAAASVRLAVERHGLDAPLDRRTWRICLPLCYTLVPETRAHWDAVSLRGQQALARDLARVAVGYVEGGDDRPLRSFEIPAPEVVRALIGFAGSAALAVGLAMAGRAEATAILTAAGPRARDVVRRVASDPSWPFGEVGRDEMRRRTRAARTLLSAVPAPPSQTLYLAVLGPLVLRQNGPGGTEVVDPELRRRRVQELLAFLVAHRRTTRAAIASTLWPDLDERSAANNLGVTLNHLLRVLDPARDQGEPSYLLRIEGASVQLVTDEFLRLDVDEFDEHVAAAARAEADSAPSLALQHDLAVVALYRDTLHLDLGDAPWLGLDREHYKTRFVAAAVRAGQLMLGRGEVEMAQTVAYRVLTSDPWSEEAYAVLVGAALARGDRSGARRLLQRCEAALTELGVGPSSALAQLRHRVDAL